MRGGADGGERGALWGMRQRFLPEMQQAAGRQWEEEEEEEEQWLG